MEEKRNGGEEGQREMEGDLYTQRKVSLG